jgi:hypothetical protein
MRKTYALFAVYQSIFHLKIRITYIYHMIHTLIHHLWTGGIRFHSLGQIPFFWSDHFPYVLSFIWIRQGCPLSCSFFFLCNFSILVYYRFITHAMSIVWWVSYGLSSSSSSSFFLSYSSTTRRKKNDKWI